ncbi:MAG: hypothetical protein COA49_08895 [Bacteroidetes bacterium]|nr:MAG: hypothetical protein COA49_08895 [Bacteroidota bacterium]
MYFIKFFAISAIAILLSKDVSAQTTIRGRVIDSSSGIGLIGASVYLEDFNEGAFTDFDGFFQFKTRAQGQTNLIATTMGYSKVKKYISLTGSGLMNMGEIILEPSSIGLEEANVIASVAVDRATPVAVSTIDAREIEEKIGDRELVEVLNFTPGIYATKGGGGYGDSRINIRGFDQRNVAVLVNGIPVNDMENGWVYWSNWAGLGDAVRTMQVQRGLGASKLAINSVGGTINIVTKATDVRKGGSFRTSITDYGTTKHMLSLSTGKMSSGWAVSAIGSRTYGDGYVDATFVDAWSYFLTAAKDFGGHRIVFTAIGAPQTHGQRRGLLTVDRFNQINSLPDSLGYEGHKWNDDWGYLDGEILNSRVNGYHKPQIALNHYFQLSERTHISTSAYVSFGKGYGSRYDGTSNPRDYATLYDGSTVKTTRDWDFLYNSNVTSTLPVTYPAFEIAYDENSGAWVDTLQHKGSPVIINGDTLVGGRARSVIENAHNEHFWTGILSTLRSELSPNLSLIAGVDMRYYEGKHFTRTSNLLGGDFYMQSFSSSTGYGINPAYELMATEGDVVDYDNVGIVKYAGFFTQLEYKSERISGFVAATGSYTGYRRYDPYTYFRYDETGIQAVTEYDEATGNYITTDQFMYGAWSEKASAPGYNAKAGGSYAVTETNHIYVNAGVYSRAPFIRNVFPNYQNVLSNENLVNEKVDALELGYRIRLARATFDLNVYHTRWKDKTIMSGPLLRPDGTEYRAFVRGLIETHDGIELEFRTKPLPSLEIGGLISIGDWRWDNDVEADILDEETNQIIDSLYIYSAGLKVGDAPQTQFGIQARMDLPKNFRIGASYVYNMDLFAQFEIDRDRSDESRIGVQPVQVPDYGYLDANISWNTRARGLNVRLGLNIQNAMNTIFMNEADETWFTNPQTGVKTQGTVDNGKLEGYWSYGRTLSFSLKIGF